MILLEVRIEIDLPEKLVEACKIGEETITEAYIKGQKLCINIYAEAPDMRKHRVSPPSMSGGTPFSLEGCAPN